MGGSRALDPMEIPWCTGFHLKIPMGHPWDYTELQWSQISPVKEFSEEHNDIDALSWNPKQISIALPPEFPWDFHGTSTGHS